AMVIGFALTLRRQRRAVRVPFWARGLAIVVLVFAGATLPTAGAHRHSSPELEHTH
ncbi:MAG: hypothetical protein H0U79_08440, partial [Solirubrobacterales bacterium]|nr:hypothetical protein [Solirubrobacterales bacterium]